MNGNWGKVILFSILFCLLGFILGRVTCGMCRGGSCDKGGMHEDACAMHGGMHGDMHGEMGKCCAMKGDSTKCMHDMDHHAMGDSSMAR